MRRALATVLFALAFAGAAFSQFIPDPNVPNELARLVKTYPEDPESGGYTLRWYSRLGWAYFFQVSEDLVTWTYYPYAIVPGGDGGDPPADGPVEYGFDASGFDRFFVRLIQVEFPGGDPYAEDFDDDKVSNVDELESGTDPLHSADLDMDGMPDDWEVRFGLTDAIDDPDEDGMDNLAEYVAGTDPTDHYNGTGYPSIVAVNLPIYPPVDEPGTLLTDPLVFEVKDGATPVNHALVTVYTEGSDFGQVSPNADGSGLARVVHLWTGSDGRVQVYFKHPSGIALEPTPRYIFAKVGSALISGSGNSVVPAVVVITQSDYIYPQNTVGLNAREAIDSRINMIATNDVANAKLIYSTQDHNPVLPALPTYIRNTASWCYDLRQQMTCISPYYSRAGGQYGFTAITQQHVITSAHVDVSSLLEVGNTVRFITADNPTTVVTRTIRGKVRHPDYNPYYPDLTVCTLDSPLPSTITPCKLLPANYADYLSHLEMGRPPAMILNQNEEARVGELHDFGPSEAPWAHFVRPGLHKKRLEFYEDLTGGDSGNPAFLIIKPPNTGLDTLVLLTTWTEGGAGSGTFVTPQISALNAMIAAADADVANYPPFIPFNTGMTVQTIDLSAFNSPP